MFVAEILKEDVAIFVFKVWCLTNGWVIKWFLWLITSDIIESLIFLLVLLSDFEEYTFLHKSDLIVMLSDIDEWNLPY